MSRLEHNWYSKSLQTRSISTEEPMHTVPELLWHCEVYIIVLGSPINAAHQVVYISDT